MQPTSRITSKGQTTIPREVRRKLSLRPGDVLVYELDQDEVRVRKQSPIDVAYLRAVQTTHPETIFLAENIGGFRSVRAVTAHAGLNP